jgi:endoglucanase
MARVGRMRRILFSLLFLGCFAPTRALATKLVSLDVLDQDYVVAAFLDGEVEHQETGSFNPAAEVVHSYGTALSAAAAVAKTNWTIASADDANYATAKNPTACSRKTKMSGQAQKDWGGSDWNYQYTYQHWIYLKLPTSMQQGKSYTVTIAASTNTDVTSKTFTYDIFNSRSEAVHVNIVGYMPDAPHKAADLYHFLGDGGQRDYSSFVGQTVYVYNVDTGVSTSAGTVALWKDASAVDLPSWGQHQFIRGNTWSADFSTFNTPGNYRLAIEGVGCSDDFVIADDVYTNPFRVSLVGFSYMRLGQDPVSGAVPPYRAPSLKPGVDPSSTTVYITTVQPFDANWSSIPSDQWDNPDSFAAYKKSGSPQNPSAWGGHADAADRDRHLGHVSIIYDMLLPYILTQGALSDDATGIPESGNGIPDIIDEAAFEVDFWLRLRDGAAYSHGLTNPNGSYVIYQAGTSAIAAWANAANAAMLAEAYRIAGKPTEMGTYRDAAITAYSYADGLADTMLDQTLDAGGSKLRGRDLKMTAAAYLYNVTGVTAYEDEVNADSVCKSSSSAAIRDTSHDQNWGTAGYLLTPQTVHYPTLQANMRTAIIADAKAQETNYISSRPSRRASDDNDGWFPTTQNVQRTIIAHAVATSQADKDLFRKALALEADWGLGRNPINRIHMTTWWTALAAKRSIEYMYTSGSGATFGGAGTGDGVLGVDPGHTPYMNLQAWGSTVAADPTKLTATCYPAFNSTWPEGEAYFNTPWVYSYSEYTPQQSFRGKTALYGYLYALGGGSGPTPTPILTVTTSGTGSGTVSSSPAGIDCGATCSASFPSGTNVTLTATPADGSTFDGWGGACSGTGTCSLTLTAAQLVTATFTSTTTTTCSVTVTEDGSGTGTVSSSPAGIDCSSDCSETYACGTDVTLTATPTGVSTFGGWSGACTGTGTCVLTVNAALAVTATFDPQCAGDADCADSNPCTEDVCDIGTATCSHTPLPCPDGGVDAATDAATDAAGTTTEMNGCACAARTTTPSLRLAVVAGATLAALRRRRRAPRSTR